MVVYLTREGKMGGPPLVAESRQRRNGEAERSLRSGSFGELRHLFQRASPSTTSNARSIFSIVSESR
jgi:hypothetical protein